MKIKIYLKDHTVHILLWAAGILTADGTVLLFRKGEELVLFLTVILLAAGSAVFLYDFFRKRKFYENLEESLEALDKKYLVVEMLKEPDFLEGRILYQSYADILKSMNDEIIRYKTVNGEFRRYVETWIHQVKLPIASAELILHNNPGDTGRRVKEQLSKIENCVEQVLYYIRSEVPQNDYSIGRYSLQGMVEEAIRENKDSLILNQFSVAADAGEQYVYTDRKWMVFILGQIISNSVKYCREEQRCIRFYTDPEKKNRMHAMQKETKIPDKTELEEHGERNKAEGVTLWVEDNGRGICSSDLPRIFEKSFTGKNGRQTASTGMGLYICSRLCRELGHRIQAQSGEGRYTRIGITFAQAPCEEQRTDE